MMALASQPHARLRRPWTAPLIGDLLGEHERLLLLAVLPLAVAQPEKDADAVAEEESRCAGDSFDTAQR